MNFQQSFFLISLLIILISCNKKEILNNKERNIEINKLQKKAIEISRKSKDSFYYFLKQTKNKITKITPDSLKAENEFLLGYYYNLTNNVDLCLKQYNKATRFTKDSIKRKREITYYKFLFEKYLATGDFLNGLGTANKFEKLITYRNDKNKQLSYIYNFKKRLYHELDMRDSTIHYNNKEIALFKLEKDTVNLIASLIDLANHSIKSNKIIALKILDSLKNVSFNYKNENQLKNEIYILIGNIKSEENKINEAINNYKKGLLFFKKINANVDSIQFSFYYQRIAASLIEVKKYNLAKKYIDSSHLYKKYMHYDIKSLSFINQLKYSFFTSKNFDAVQQSYDSIARHFNNNEDKRIKKEFFALQEANLKEKNLLIANQKKELTNISLKKNLFILFLVLLLGTIIGILYYKQKQLLFNKDKIFLQQRLFRSQMNPHFTSNILVSIQKLIEEDSKLANKYLIHFSRLLRLTLDNSLQNYVPIEKEIEVLNKYLELQKLRFPNSFEYKIETSEIEDLDMVHIPPMFIQPFVENTIEHGFQNINYLGKIEIKLIQRKNYITCIIKDNGKGLTANKSTKNHISASTKLIKQVLKKMTNEEVKIINNKDKGVTVEFNIPLKFM